MAKRGQPTKLTAESQEMFLQRLATGAPRRVAAASIGAARSTVELWLHKGRAQEKGRYRDFLDKVEAVEAEVHLICAGSIVLAARGNPEKGIAPDWKAAITYLERRHGKLWGRKDQLGLGLGLPGLPKGTNGHRPHGAYTLNLHVVDSPPASKE